MKIKVKSKSRTKLIVGILIIASIIAIFMAAKLVKQSGSLNKIVVMKTNMGTVEIELYGDKSPETVKNFLKYVNDGYYNGLIFHRVMDGFMIQGGGFAPGMKEKTTTYPPIVNEAKTS